VGSVAEEAARLLDALGGWASTAHASYAAQPASSAGPAPQEAADKGRLDGEGGGRCASCGAQDAAGGAVPCQLCPVCQGIGLLRSVRPETVDRLADLAGALAATLRDIAGARRADTGTETPAGTARRAADTRVQDISIEDEDEQTGSATS
jgi:hypothetical protein